MTGVKQQQPDCMQCKQPMERGHGIDNTHAGVLPSQWVPGAPRRSWWTGLKVDKAAKVPITMFRCPRCGRLESYAWPETR